MDTYIVGITGASGSVYALRTADALLEQGCSLYLVATEMGRRVVVHETGFTLEEWAAKRERIVIEDNMDLFSPLASGSRYWAGMVVAPCSMSTLGRLANGVTTDLLARAADVMLKQRRPLVLMPRETPLSSIHLRNMLALSEAGAFLLPAMPGFYHRPQTIEDLVSFMAGKVLDCLGIKNNLYPHWKGDFI